MSEAGWGRLWRSLFVLLLVALLAYAPKAVKESHKSDFERYFYAGCVALRGGDIYQVQDDREFKYFPVFAQSVAPVARLAEYLSGEEAFFARRTVLVGAAVWYLLLCGAYLGSLLLLHSLLSFLSAREKGFACLAGVVLSARFFVDNIRLGQINLIVFFFALLGVWCVLRGRERWGGLSIAYAACLKFMPVVFLFWLLLRGRWRASVYCLLGVMVCTTLLPALTWGWSGNLDLLQRYIGARHQMVTGIPKDHAPGQSIPSMVNRLLRPVNATALRDKEPVYVNVADWPVQTTKRIALVLVLLASGLAVWGLRRSASALPQRVLLEAGLVFLLMLLISPEARRAHFVTVLVPGTALMAWGLACGRWRIVLGWLGAVFVPMALSSKGILGAGTLNTLANAYGVVFWGALLLFAVFLWVLRRPASPMLAQTSDVDAMSDNASDSA